MQANKFRIPRLGFINKLDRTGANVQLTVDSIKRRLKVEPLLINVPGSENSLLKGIIDLPSMNYIEYLDEKGKIVNIDQIEKGHEMFDRALEYRNILVE
jgi:elongation factor G